MKNILLFVSIFITFLISSNHLLGADISFPLISDISNTNNGYRVLDGNIYLNRSEQKLLKEDFNKVMSKQSLNNNDQLIVLISALIAREVSPEEILDKKKIKSIEKISNLLNYEEVTVRSLKNFPSNISHKAMLSLKAMAKYSSKSALFALQALLIYYAMPAGQLMLAAKITSLGTIITPTIMSKVIPGAIASLTTELQSKLFNQLGVKVEDYLSTYFESNQMFPGSKIEWRDFSYSPLEQLFSNLHQVELLKTLLDYDLPATESFLKSQILSLYMAIDLDIRAIIRQTSGLIINDQKEGILIIAKMASELKNQSVFTEVLNELDNKNSQYKKSNMIGEKSLEEIQLFQNIYHNAASQLNVDNTALSKVVENIDLEINGESKTYFKATQDVCRSIIKKITTK